MDSNNKNGHYRILVVDDEEEILEIIMDLLRSEGYECFSAHDGIAATEILEHQEIDLLISDFRMPRMDGSELLKWCRENDKHFPVIFITGNPELLEKEKYSLQDCCAALLHKPISFDIIVEAIDAARTRNHQWECHRPFIP